MIIKLLFIILFVVSFVDCGSFRKERIYKVEHVEKIDLDFENSNDALKIETYEGNTYLLSKDKDGVLITDGIKSNEWKTMEKFYIRRRGTIGDVLDAFET